MMVSNYVPGKFIVFDSILNAVKRAGWVDLKIEVFESKMRTECCVVFKNYSFTFEQNKDGYKIQFAGHWTRRSVHFLKKVTLPTSTRKTRYRRPKVRKFVAHSLVMERRKDKEIECDSVIDS